MSAEPVTQEQAREVAEEARQQTWEQPSFGKELFLGRFDLGLIHPHPRPAPEEVEAGESFLQRLEAFCREHVDPMQIERDAAIPAEVIDGLRELGALGMKIPTEFGGLGLSQVYYNRALMLAGSWHSSLSTLLSAHQSIGVPRPITLFGTEEQQAQWLPRCTREISAFLLTEPDVGSDPARMGTTAVPSDDGTEYLLDGVKLWTTNGTIADLAVVMARVPERDGNRGGISAFVIECAWPGVIVEHRNQFMGLRGIENGVTRFDGVRVPAANRIGEEGEGLKIALTTLNTGRLSLPATTAASAKASLRIAREWCDERIQWGRRIGEHEAVAQHVAFIAGSAFGLEAVAELSAALADAGTTDIRIEAALAKLYGSELGWEVVDRLVQVRGGRGYETAASLQARGEKPVPVEQMLRDARINRIFEGSTEIMHLLIAREAVDEHLKVAGDLVEPDVDAADKLRAAAAATAFYTRWLPSLAAGRGVAPTAFDREFGPLAEHVRYVERASRRLARNTFYGMSRWQARLERKQAFLARVVDIGAELFAISAACARARMLVDDGEVEDAASVRDLADLFCRQARRRAEHRFDQLWDNDDETTHELAVDVLDGRFTWAERGVLDASGDGPMISEPTPGGGDVRVDLDAAPEPASDGQR